MALLKFWIKKTAKPHTFSDTLEVLLTYTVYFVTINLIFYIKSSLKISRNL
ncbi:hypothetical protein GAMM_170094 [Gammaproteobacteria bacterium]